MRSWVRISWDAAVGGIIFLKLGGPLVPVDVTFSPPLVPVPDPGLVPDAYSRVGNRD